MPQRVGYDLQGMFSGEAQVTVGTQDAEYASTFEGRVAGDFVEYGVVSNHAVWVAQCLACLLPDRQAPPSGLLDAPVVGTAPHQTIEDVRVRVFEAEVSCLPVDIVEPLLKARKFMRKSKSRVDLCVKILVAMEGRGRRIAASSMDKLKLQFEKAELSANQEVERDTLRKEKHRIRVERVKRGKAEQRKRKRQSAQANFMMKFIKKDDDSRPASSSSSSPPLPNRDGVPLQSTSHSDSTSLSWRLQIQLSPPTVETMDRQFRPSPEQRPGLQPHLKQCLERRKIAVQRLQTLLKEQRKLRRSNMDNSNIRFSEQRAEVRGRGRTGPIKLLQFDENHRPAFFGTFSERSKIVYARKPLAREQGLDYDYDSADEWDDEEEGEDLLGIEAEKELANEEDELRRLYGSDDEDDDDFLDDADAVDDDDDAEGADGEEDEKTAASNAMQEGNAPAAAETAGSDVVDLTLAPIKGAKQESGVKRMATDVPGRRHRKRRKGLFKQSVAVSAVSIPNGEASPLDRYAVTTFNGPAPIQMFNPFVYDPSTIAAEHLKAKAPSIRTYRPSTMDDKSKLELAASLIRGGSKDKMLVQFCEDRRKRGLKVPNKAEVSRAIAEIATWEKRDGDSRPRWHLNDAQMASKVQRMNFGPPAQMQRIE